MEGLLRVQLDAKSKIEKGLRNFKKSPKERLTETYVQSRLESLENTWKLFTSTHNEILKGYDEKTAGDYLKNETYDCTEEVFIEYKSELKTVLRKFAPVSVSASISGGTATDSQGVNSMFKLPKINIPVFSGKYAEWPTFRDLFISLIHSNKNIDTVQKLHYLKGYLTGEAEQLLRQIPVSGDNYERAWNILLNRYNNKKYLSSCILNRLLGQRDLTSDSAYGLKNLVDTSTDCLDALSNLGIDVSTWDILIIHILSSKLDAETKKQWELHVSSQIGFDSLPKFDQFKTFVTNRYRALEFLVPIRSNKSMSNYKPVNKVFHVNKLCCSFCEEEHKLSYCKKFIQCSVDERRDFVQTKGLCFNCMGINHSAKNCSVSTHCKICRRLHHTMLHPKGNGSSTGNEGTLSSNVVVEDMEQPSTSDVANGDSPDEINDHDEYGEVVTSCLSTGKIPGQVLLATALVHAETNNGNQIVIRALLDQGSQACFVTESTVQLLGLKKTHTQSMISGLGCDKNVTSTSIVKIKLHSRMDSKRTIEVNAYVLKAITSFLPAREVVSLGTLNLTGLVLADPNYHTPGRVDVLLGADVYGQIVQEGLRKDPDGKLLAQATTFGWIISGKVEVSTKTTNLVAMHLTVEENFLKKFWELEEEPLVNKEKILTEEENECERIYRETTTRDKEGRYIVKIPFKVEKPKIEGSREIARKRFDLLEKRLNRNNEFKSKFNNVMKEYIINGHMEIVPPEEINNLNSVYVPTLAVIRKDKDTTSVRIVCDSSCKGKDGISINEKMMKGPILQQELRHILLRWRTYPICLVADIAKMYLQIKVTKSDTDYQRLWWRPDDCSEIQVYRMLRVTFGTASAPYLAVRTLQQVAYDEGEQYPVAKNRVLTDFYMDDLMTGCGSVAEALKIQKEMSEMLSKGGFQLRKWTSNRNEIIQKIDQAMGNEEPEKFNIKSDTVLKILGLTWDRQADEFQYSVEVTPLQEPVTKRKILSEISRLYDPLGWVSPCIIVAKVLIQKLWLKGSDWDEPVTEELYKEWVTYRQDLPLLKGFHVSRWLGMTDDCCVELHGFSDASKIAYAAVVYARVIHANGDIKVKLVTAKTKVAPIKMVAIPRLELCGAALLAKLLIEVAEVLSIMKENIYAWTDSTVVLAWINSYPRRWKPFVANRVSDILSLLEPTQWAFVASKENPADVASRGMYPKEILVCKLWIQGPNFLIDRKIDRTKKNFNTKEEEIKVHVVIESDSEEGLWKRFSSLSRMVRVLAYCRRFANLVKTKKEAREVESFLTSKELEDSLRIIIKRCQEIDFKEEIRDLHDKGILKKNNRISSLNPFIDKKGILRVGGRLTQSCLSDDAIHPIVLHKNSKISQLIVSDAHYRLLHGGQQLMLNFIRNKYWILGVKHLIKTTIHKCNKCIRYSNRTRNQLMGQLPEARASPSRPFSQSGVDFAGPINVRTSKGRGHHAYKGYICLFVCMATRAIHLEVVSDLTAQGFLAAFRRFVARRGHCAQLWSDNGKNFIGASKELRHLFACEKSGIIPDIREALANNQTTWHFIPPYSPNFGGLWEAGIKSTKFHLKRVIGDSTLTYEELSTVLIQIEACLNSRPLSRIDSDGGNHTILTPGHFIIGEPLVTVPDQNYENHAVGSLRRWQLTQRMLQGFWSRWSQEYLHQFLQRHKWTEQFPEPKVGDVVLIKELDLPPARWLIGKVIETHPGVDGIARVVTIHAKNSTFKRPVSKLCLLPAAE